MHCLSSFSHAWTHVVIQYRAQSLLPCPFYHKSQSSEASNHKSTDEATIISLFADSASPSTSSRNHLTALVLQVVLVKDFLDANKAVVSACGRHLRTNYHGLPQWCSPLNALSLQMLESATRCTVAIQLRRSLGMEAPYRQP